MFPQLLDDEYDEVDAAGPAADGFPGKPHLGLRLLLMLSPSSYLHLGHPRS